MSQVYDRHGVCETNSNAPRRAQLVLPVHELAHHLGAYRIGPDDITHQVFELAGRMQPWVRMG